MDVNTSVKNNIVKTVCDFFDIKEEDIHGNGQNRKLTTCRIIIAYILKMNTDMTLSEIAKCLGRKDHVSVIYYVAQYEQRMLSDMVFMENVITVVNNFRDVGKRKYSLRDGDDIRVRY